MSAYISTQKLCDEFINGRGIPPPLSIALAKTQTPIAQYASIGTRVMNRHIPWAAPAHVYVGFREDPFCDLFGSKNHGEKNTLIAMRALPRSFFEQDAVALAPRLLGKVVRRGSCLGRIVETEAYGSDPASHAYKVTPRSAVMRDTYGHWYVYFTYGMHWCANVTCDKGGIGAVLIRAVEPIEGIALMKRRRGVTDIKNLCSGPAKFCEAFGITKRENGLMIGNDFDIFEPRIGMIYHTNRSSFEIASGPRIGIKNARHLHWRFFIKDNLFVSRS